MTVDVQFDGSYLRATDCSPDPASIFSDAECNRNFASNTVRFTLLGPGGVYGTIHLADITFEVYAEPFATLETPVDLDVAAFDDLDGHPIPYTMQNGTITIFGLPTPLSSGAQTNLACSGPAKTTPPWGIFTATLTDNGGTPLNGKTIAWSGYGVAGESLTNEAGVAEFRLFVPFDLGVDEPAVIGASFAGGPEYAASSCEVLTQIVSPGFPKAASIAGTVFVDSDTDGEPDGEEARLQRWGVTLSQGDNVLVATETNEVGHYTFYNLVPGEYTVTASSEPPPSGGLCVDSFDTFDPFLISTCGIGGGPWVHTSSASVTVDVIPEETAEAHFGLASAGVDLSGVAILHDDYAPAGTIIEGRFNGNECGTGQVISERTGHNVTFELRAYNNLGREGCPEPGDHFEFLIDDVPANETYECCRGALVDLSATPDHAWYWVEREAETGASEGLLVTATIDGVECGQATVATKVRGGDQTIVGFGRLIVPSAAVQEGCGRPGKEVRFVVGDASTTVGWEAGVQRVDLAVERVGPVAVPALGGTPANQRRADLDVALLVGGAGMLTLAVLLVAITGGTNRRRRNLE
ncbi:MAG TPA: SdrD B-like domain-containing protein [Dehalococcoidia bacterium]|nr:SdrD B-like domain-containing protein [Dehalococcoidia bacterium]